MHFNAKTVPLGPMMLYGDTAMGPGPLIMLCDGVKISSLGAKITRCDIKIFVLGLRGVHFNDKTVPLEPMMLYGDIEMDPGPLIMMCGGVKILVWAVKNTVLQH